MDPNVRFYTNLNPYLKKMRKNGKILISVLWLKERLEQNIYRPVSEWLPCQMRLWLNFSPSYLMCDLQSHMRKFSAMIFSSKLNPLLLKTGIQKKKYYLNKYLGQFLRPLYCHRVASGKHQPHQTSQPQMIQPEQARHTFSVM